VHFTVPSTFDQVAWLGDGPGDSYLDMALGARLGTHTGHIDAMNTMHARPQESGHRANDRYLKLPDADGRGLRIASGPGADGPAGLRVLTLVRSRDRRCAASV
jgi:beta-galactosidase